MEAHIKPWVFIGRGSYDQLLDFKWVRVDVFFKTVFSLFQTTAAANNISATPSFLFFRNRVRIDQYQGADSAGLEEKIKQHTENDPGNSEDSDIPKGYVSDPHLPLTLQK